MYDLVDQSLLERLFGSVEALLHNAASVLVTWDLEAVCVQNVIEKLFISLWVSSEYFLDHMVCIHIFRQRNDHVLQLLLKEFDSLWGLSSLDELLVHSGSMLIVTYFDKSFVTEQN